MTKRPVVSAGQYGYNLNQLLFTVDPATGEVQVAGPAGRTSCRVNTGAAANYPADPAARRSSTRPSPTPRCSAPWSWARSAAPFNRAKLADGTTENRGGESTLGNLVAEVQRWATESATEPARRRSPS